MKIRSAEAVGEQAWDQAVRTLPGGTFCHLAGWRRVCELNFGFPSLSLIAEDDGGIVGLLPLFLVRRWPFPAALISSPVCVYGGTLAYEPAVHEALAAHARELARRHGVQYLELRDVAVQREGWQTTDRYYTFKRELPVSADETLTSIPTRQRAEVRKGIKAGLTFKTASSIDAFYPVYAESMRNLGSPGFKRRYYQSLLDVFGSAVEVATAFDGDVPVSSVINFFFGDEILLYYGGGTAQARQLRSTQFLYWQVMNRAIERDARIFDFGRSMRDTGTFSFKTYWKFEPSPLHYHYLPIRGAVPDLSPDNPRLALAARVWSRLPLPVAGVVGPFTARAIV